LQDLFKILRRISALLKESRAGFIAIGEILSALARWTRLTNLAIRPIPLPPHTTMGLVVVWIRVSFVTFKMLADAIMVVIILFAAFTDSLDTILLPFCL
jgi:hypothetical protein